jgi:hypothetical protein
MYDTPDETHTNIPHDLNLGPYGTPEVQNANL